jgi:hypothetical protein
MFEFVAFDEDEDIDNLLLITVLLHLFDDIIDFLRLCYPTDLSFVFTSLEEQGVVVDEVDAVLEVVHRRSVSEVTGAHDEVCQVAEVVGKERVEIVMAVDCEEQGVVHFE